ncbi:MAG: hypothetical protein AAGH41_08260 [Pseudomonadota bacterium]
MATSVRTATIKLVIAMIFDAADLAVGLIPVPGPGALFDAVLSVVAVMMFGWKGLFQLWELANLPFDMLDGFVPTLTLIAIAELRGAKKSEAATDERLLT